MFLLRLRPVVMLLLIVLPLAAGAVLQAAADLAGKNTQLQLASTALSFVFAMIFCAWIAALTWKLARGTLRRLVLLFLLLCGVVFRAWQDCWSVNKFLATGKMPSVEEIDPLSAIFILHALVSLFVVYLLVWLSVSLVKKEKSSGISSSPLWQTLLSFFVFPVGVFFIQRRIQRLS
ncbi:MAG TPA: hypothetical protein VFU15_06850 [Bacteroidia bacterium]|nr:hypothetical protein [Bacteroidia bacterium]